MTSSISTKTESKSPSNQAPYNGTSTNNDSKNDNTVTHGANIYLAKPIGISEPIKHNSLQDMKMATTPHLIPSIKIVVSPSGSVKYTVKFPGPAKTTPVLTPAVSPAESVHDVPLIDEEVGMAPEKWQTELAKLQPRIGKADERPAALIDSRAKVSKEDVKVEEKEGVEKADESKEPCTTQAILEEVMRKTVKTLACFIISLSCALLVEGSGFQPAALGLISLAFLVLAAICAASTVESLLSAFKIYATAAVAEEVTKGA